MDKRHELLQELGGTVRSIRELSGSKIFEVADTAGVTHSFVSKVELGRQLPGKKSFDRIARAVTEDPAEQAALTDQRDSAAIQLDFQFEENISRLLVRINRLLADSDPPAREHYLTALDSVIAGLEGEDRV